ARHSTSVRTACVPCHWRCRTSDNQYQSWPRCTGTNLRFHRPIFRRRLAVSDAGGTFGGQFSVKMGNFRLVYKEGGETLTIPVEILLRNAGYNIGVALIRHWDGSSTPFTKEQAAQIKANIFAALDFMRVRFTNAI